MDLKTPLARSSVSCNDPPFSLNNIGLFDFTAPFPTAITIQRLIAILAVHVPIMIVLTFAIRSSERRFGQPFRSRFSFLVLATIEFPIVDGYSKKSILWISFIEKFECSFGSMNQSICSNLSFDLF